METALPLDHAACESARLARDARFDGVFFTAVRSTGIYCRPVCPAPAPKPSNVTYFPTAAAAAGFFGRHATGPVPLFEVDDVRAALRELEHADVEIVGTLDQDRVWEWIHFRAPDGNLYELASRRAAASDDRTTPSSSAPRVWVGYGGEGTWQDDLGRVTMASGTECAHSGCTCVTADEFCSDFCRGHGGEAHEHASTGGAGCGCGHPACGS